MAVFGLKTKMSVVAALLLLALMTLLSTLIFTTLERSFRRQIETQQFTFISALAEQIDEKVEMAQKSVVTLAASITPAMVSSSDRAQEFLNDRLSARIIFDNGLFLFSPNGRLIAETPYLPGRRGKDFSFREYLQQTLRTGEPYISVPYHSSKEHHHPAVSFSAPVRDAKGRTIAVLSGSVDLLGNNFLGRLAQITIGKSGYLYLFDKDRTMIIHPDKTRLLKRDVAPGVNPLYDRAVAGFEGSGETVNSRGRHVIASFKRVRNTNWILASNYPVSEAVAPINAVKSFRIPVVAIMILLTIAIVWVTMHYLTIPVSHLTKQMKEISRDGNDLNSSRHRNGDEIKELDASFQTMMRTLADKDRSLQILSRAVEQSSAIVVITDVNGTIEYVNVKFSEATGYSREEVIGNSIRLLEPDDLPADAYNEFWKQIMAGNEWRGEFRNKKKDGELFWALTTVSPIKGDQGSIDHFLSIQEDVTERRVMAAALERSEANYHAIFHAANDAIFVLDPETGAIMDVNRATCEMYGYSRQEALHLHMEELGTGPLPYMLATAGTNGTGKQIFEWRTRDKSGRELWVEVNLKRAAIGGRERLLAVVRDIRERKEFEERLVEMAHHDNLTGLPNRNLLQEKLGSTMAYAARYQKTVGLLFIDLDDFKEVNDSLGHAAGDQLLHDFAIILRTLVRESDTVARLGGDEFIILLADLTTANDAVVVAEKILAALKVPFVLRGKSVTVGVSIGIAVYPRDGETELALIHHADAAMYRAKQEGKNSYRLFSPHAAA